MIELVVDHHDAVGGAYLVRMGAGRHADGGELFGILRVADVDQRGAVRAAHMADIGDVVLHHDLPAARAIEIADLP